MVTYFKDFEEGLLDNEQTLHDKPRDINSNQVADALEEFVNNYYWSKDLTGHESLQKIENAVVELAVQGQHSSNGVLMTDSGYFLTASHCVDMGRDRELFSANKETGYSSRSPFRIHLNDGSSYAVEHLCWADPSEDVAIVKANMPGSGNPFRYSFINPGDLDLLKDAPASHLSRWDGKLHTRRARINNNQEYRITMVRNDGSTFQIKNYFTLDHVKGCPGDSGGLIVSPHGRLMGLLSGGSLEGSGLMLGVKVEWALGLVRKYAQHLRSNA